MKIIARVKSDFPVKFGIPRQSGRVEALKAMVVMEPECRNPDVFRGLEEFSHIWLLWEFSEAADKGWSPTVRPPRLGGNVRKGVFATRSPFRPNPIGLSSVKLEKIEMNQELGPVLHISGADLMDGTPVYDIKPYVETDCHPDAEGGFTKETKEHSLTVNISEELLFKIPQEKREAVLAVLKEDPRPGYQNDPERIYGMPFGDQDIRFSVKDGVLTVCEVKEFKRPD